MSLLQVVVLAIVQAVTEFLPISSSAHLALAPWLFGWPDQGLTFDIALHFGTLLAVLLYFYREWLQILARGFRIPLETHETYRRNPSLLWLLAAGTAPVGIAGLFFRDSAENAWRHNHYLIGGMLIAVGLLMLAAERAAAQRKGMDSVSLADSLSIGMAQALAVVPGTSRSGITITAGLFRHLDRATAARFSFLLATPAIGAAALQAAWNLWRQGGIPPGMRLEFFLGVVLSAVTGAAVIAWFLKFVARRSLHFFVYYRVFFGIIVIALAFSRR
ncbi:MAG: undecaprenyl-diphosphate phosphatase [Acidobacteria bacterium]|nr:undecaprenyl-diphosphate phosphatase [Acidobacteriota bacterium]